MFGTQLMSRVVWIFFIPPCPHDLRSDTMITTIWQGSHNMYNNMISLSYNNRQGSKYIIGEHLINYPLSRADLLIKILMYIRRIEGMRVAPYRMWKGDWIIITDTHMLVAMIIVCFWIQKYSWPLFPFFPFKFEYPQLLYSNLYISSIFKNFDMEIFKICFYKYLHQWFLFVVWISHTQSTFRLSMTSPWLPWQHGQ